MARRRNMYSIINCRGLGGSDVAYNSVDVTSYAAFINSLTDEEKKRCHVEIESGDFDIVGVRLSCESRKDIDVFNKIVEKASNMFKILYLDDDTRYNANDEEDY